MDSSRFLVFRSFLFIFFIIILDSPSLTFANGLHLPNPPFLLASYFPMASGFFLICYEHAYIFLCVCVCYFHENSMSLMTFHLHNIQEICENVRESFFLLWKMKMMMIWWPEKHKWIMFYDETFQGFWIGSCTIVMT